MLFETIHDLKAGEDRIRSRRYGVIKVVDGRLDSIRLRPLPKLATPECVLLGQRYHARRQGNVCLVYYNQPLRFPNFLALKYANSSQDCTIATILTAQKVLEEVARIKRTDAMLCDAANLRISDRLLARWGWESHTSSRWHRNYIKRFYGNYPPPLSLQG